MKEQIEARHPEGGTTEGICWTNVVIPQATDGFVLHHDASIEPL